MQVFEARGSSLAGRRPGLFQLVSAEAAESGCARGLLPCFVETGSRAWSRLPTALLRETYALFKCTATLMRRTHACTRCVSNCLVRVSGFLAASANATRRATRCDAMRCNATGIGYSYKVMIVERYTRCITRGVPRARARPRPRLAWQILLSGDHNAEVDAISIVSVRYGRRRRDVAGCPGCSRATEDEKRVDLSRAKHNITTTNVTVILIM